MRRGIVSRFGHRRLPVALAVLVLSAHVVGTALSGLLIGPTFVLVVSSSVAAGLWAVVRAGRTGPLPARVRASLLAVWLVPVALLWAAAGVSQVSAAFFPSRPPDNEGVIEAVSASPFGGVSLRLRVAPVPREGWPAPKDEQEERSRQWVGIIVVHVPPSARVRGQPASGPQVGQRARTWCKSFVMESFPPQQVAEYVEYQPAGG
jgi:hypothetical protein